MKSFVQDIRFTPSADGTRLAFAGNGQGFHERGIAAQFILSRMPNLAGYNKERLVKVLQRNRDERFMENALIRDPDGFLQLWDGLILHFNIACAIECNKAIRLNRNRLVEFR